MLRVLKMITTTSCYHILVVSAVRCQQNHLLSFVPSRSSFVSIFLELLVEIPGVEGTLFVLIK